MKYLITFIFLILAGSLISQTLPLAEIEGRLSIYHPLDTTSIHIGKSAGISQDDFPRSNLFIGNGAGKMTTFGASNSFLGVSSGQHNVGGSDNVFIGQQSGYFNESGSYNNFMGGLAGVSNTTGSYNCFLGYYAGYTNETGNFNSFLGVGAGFSSKGGHNTALGALSFSRTFAHGSFNTAVGDSSMYDVDTDGEIAGSYNVAVGASSLFAKTLSYTNRSVGLGYEAGYNGGVGSVFIGYQAGRNAVGDKRNDRLYIANSDEEIPLIYGEFDTGNIGLGTTDPQERLHISGGSTEARLLFDNAGDIMWKTSSGSIRPILTLHLDDHTYLDGEKDIVFRTKSDFQQRMRITENGNVGIGINNPSHLLDVAGDIRGISLFCSNGSACNSDVRFKRDFQRIDNSISKLEQVNGYYHYWKNEDFPEYQFSDGQAIGFKAQEIQKIFPELVQTMPDGYLAVNYAKMAPLLVEAIKEQQAKIANLLEVVSILKSAVAQRDEQFDDLTSRLEKLELNPGALQVED